MLTFEGVVYMYLSVFWYRTNTFSLSGLLWAGRQGARIYQRLSGEQNRQIYGNTLLEKAAGKMGETYDSLLYSAVVGFLA